MRRWILQFLLIVLPLQFSWAAVAAACAHEPTAATASHVGHHTHVHKAEAGSQLAAEKAGKVASDPDCPQCHLGCSAAAADLVAWSMPALANPRPADPPLHPHSLTPPGPERPNWRLRT